MTFEYETVGDFFGWSLAGHGLAVESRNNWFQGSNLVVVGLEGARELRIADSDGLTHSAPSEWAGGLAVVCPADEDSGSVATGEVLYESPGPGDFTADSARLISAVLEFLRQTDHRMPPREPAKVNRDLALAHLALADAGWRPQAWHDPQDWREELNADHAAYLKNKAIAVGADELDTLRKAAAEGAFDLTPYRDLSEARDAVRHSCLSVWRVTPYGTVWVDEAA